MIKLVNKNEIDQYQDYQAQPTEWFTVNQEQINQFADCTLDHQYIHVDPEKAKESPFGTTIAHGFLSLSMLSYFAADSSLIIDGFYMGVNYGFDKVRFIAPVKVDSRIRANTKIMNITEKKPGHYMVKTEVTVEIEGEEKPALIAEWLGMQMVA
ncbi:MAG: MaoC family dehydratase [Pseudomonadales bacterium]